LPRKREPESQERLETFGVEAGPAPLENLLASDVIQGTSTNLPPATRLSKRARLLVSEASRSTRRPQSTLH